MEYGQKYLTSCLRAIPAVATSFTRKVRGNLGVRARTLLRLAVIVPFAALLYSPSSALAQVSLGAAESFAVLGASTVTNTGATIITGDLGVSPGTAITGFPPGIVTGGTIHASDAVAAQAHSAAVLAYAELAGLPCLPINNLSGMVLGTDVMTLTPGVYCFDSSAQLTGTLFLTGGGPWIFQIGSTLTTASNSSVLVKGQPHCDGLDVFWQVGSSATLGTGTQFVGNILALASITLTTNVSVSGRALALTGAVTMDTNTVSVCSTATSRKRCNQGVGNGPEICDPGNSNQGDPSRSNDEEGGKPGTPGRKGGNGK